MLIVSGYREILERWYEAIEALCDHRDACTECQPGGARCEAGQRLHQDEQDAYLEARR